MSSRCQPSTASRSSGNSSLRSRRSLAARSTCRPRRENGAASSRMSWCVSGGRPWAHDQMAAAKIQLPQQRQSGQARNILARSRRRPSACQPFVPLQISRCQDFLTVGDVKYC
jgi:hypothetical protein